MKQESVSALLSGFITTPGGFHITAHFSEEHFINYLKEVLSTLPELPNPSDPRTWSTDEVVEYYSKIPSSETYHSPFSPLLFGCYPIKQGKLKPLYGDHVGGSCLWQIEAIPVAIIKHSELSQSFLPDDYLKIKEEKLKKQEYGLIDYVVDLQATDPLFEALKKSPVDYSVLLEQHLTQSDWCFREEHLGPFLIAAGIDKSLIKFWQGRNTYKKIWHIKDQNDPEWEKKATIELKFADFRW